MKSGGNARPSTSQVPSANTTITNAVQSSLRVRRKRTKYRREDVSLGDGGERERHRERGLLPTNRHETG